LKDPGASWLYARFKQSNLPFFQALWDEAKRRTGVLRLKQHNSQRHIVADGGLQWIKVSTITEKRLLMEMANKGWGWHCSDDDMDEDEAFQTPLPPDDDEDFGISFIKTAKQLIASANETVIRYRRPEVIFVLTRISAGKILEVDMVLDKLRNLGVKVITKDEISPAPTLTEDVMNRMVFNEFQNFTPTLNIDCTILLALVSDISHNNIEEIPWFNRNTKKQLEMEDKEKLLPSSLWPAMGNRRLVCTDEAARRMREITEEIGTETEKVRMKAMFDDGPGVRSQAELVASFQKLSIHTVPLDWQLPIQICTSLSGDDHRLPAVARDVAFELTELNRSVFLFGWVTGYTTLTGNRTMARLIEHMVVEGRVDNEMGPDIWLSYNGRSLLAKEKDRRDG
jgi:Protein of unknown function (DUF1308)